MGKPATAALDGRFGEEQAARHLAGHGYAVQCYNYKTRRGEIDVVAQNASTLVFAEVKTRRVGALVPGEAAVTAAKQRRLVLAAEAYLQEHPTSLQPRFDVFVVELAANGSVHSLRWYENAFEAT